jgi:UDP:flavonoid glycosyltransferase YjiC (YdhE family)
MGIDYTLGNFSERWPALRDVPAGQGLTFIMAHIYAGDLAAHALPDLLALAQGWRPDVIIRDIMEFGGWLAAEALGIPHVSVETSLFAYYQPAAAAVAASLSQFLEASGRSASDVAMRLFAYLHLSFIPMSFEDPAALPPPTTRSLRAQPLVAAPGEQSPEWLTELPDRPTIYATLGTVPVFTRPVLFDAIITGVRDLDVNLITTLGRNLEPEQFGPQPSNVHLVRYISQALLLPRCDVVIAHGGLGTVLGTLSHGIPMVLVPLGADQPANVARAVALGTGIALEPDQRTPDAIRDAVRAVLADPTYRRNAERVRDEMAALPGPEYAVELLERLARGKQPPLAS